MSLVDEVEVEGEIFDIEEIELVDIFRECERERDRPWEGFDRLSAEVLVGWPDPSLNDSN